MFFYTWVVLQVLSNSSHSSASDLSRVLSGWAQWHRPSWEFMIAPLDWPWLSGTTNAGVQGTTTQPPLPAFTQKNTCRLFSVSHSLLHSQTFRETTTGCFGFTFLLGAAGVLGWQPGLWEMLGNTEAGQSWKKFKENTTLYFIYHKTLNPFKLS